MIPQVALIGHTKIDWYTYLLIASKILSRPINTINDTNNIAIDTNLSAFTISLAELKDPSIKINSIYTSVGNLLLHTSLNFICVSDHELIFEIMEESDLFITSIKIGSERLSIISGNLDQWKSATIDNCSELSGKNLRIFFDKILLIFESIGLGQFFRDYQKIALKDNSFKLELK